MDLVYEPIRALRAPIGKAIGKTLDFFKGFHPAGEAHITVVTPPEFTILQTKISITEINAAARRFRIQYSDVKILGLGSARKVLDGVQEETFFAIVDSMNLRRIRHVIRDEFVRRGGAPNAFDPTWFFPHITIGYTKRDLYESDGARKNISSSLDPRFRLRALP